MHSVQCRRVSQLSKMYTAGKETDVGKAKSIEESLIEIQQIIDTMEQGGQTLEEALASYETGIKLIRSCGRQIDKVEKKIRILNEVDEDETV